MAIDEDLNGEVLFPHGREDRYLWREEVNAAGEPVRFQIRYGLSWDLSECVGHIHAENHAMLICLLVNQGLTNHNTANPFPADPR